MYSHGLSCRVMCSYKTLDKEFEFARYHEETEHQGIRRGMQRLEFCGAEQIMRVAADMIRESCIRRVTQ
jgi:hypothetical protein